jgi:branched-chain amino acid transport system permease protein
VTVARRRPLIIAVCALLLALVPLCGITLPGVFDGPLDSPGTLNLLALCFVFGALALTYDLVFGFAGLLNAFTSRCRKRSS